MAIHRIVKTGNFTLVDNKLLHNKKISPLARLLLITILSLKDSAGLSIKRLANMCGMGQDAVRTCVQELMDKGYINRRRERISGQYGKMLYDIYEDPSLNPAVSAAPAPEQENPIQAPPASDAPVQAEPHDNILYINKDVLDNNTQSINQDRRMDEQIRTQIEYDILCRSYDRRLLDDLVGVMVEAMVARTETITVSKTTVLPTDYIRDCISRITPLHVEQIMNKLDDTKPIITNARGYLLTALINAANTMSMTYQYGDY